VFLIPFVFGDAFARKGDFLLRGERFIDAKLVLCPLADNPVLTFSFLKQKKDCFVSR
jgi:hypothetical protein